MGSGWWRFYPYRIVLVHDKYYNSDMEHIHWDVLVVGSGAAGLRAAIAAHNKGLSVCVISKGLPGMGTSTDTTGRQGDQPTGTRTCLGGRRPLEAARAFRLGDQGGSSPE